MSYVASVLQPGEKVLHVGVPHWITYWRSLASFALAVIVLKFRPESAVGAEAFWIAAGAICLVGVLFAIHTAFLRWTQEISVTDKRVIYKRGFISLRTQEMNMDKVETVSVEQSLLGRLLGYGTVTIRGSGESIERLKFMTDPVRLRGSISAQ